MPRGKRIRKRIIEADPIYQSRQVTKLVNRVMQDGKKQVAFHQVYAAFDLIKKKLKDQDPVLVLQQALDNLKPNLEVRSRRVGGAAYQVPMPVKGDRREALAIRWLILEARKRPNKEFHTFAEKLAGEIIDAYHFEGGAIKKKQDTHRMADANKAFGHFRW
jgi:small subunit ribosomal protein S7